jgi:regulator of sirC expression with transglutaminase-like and TPR domain
MHSPTEIRERFLSLLRNDDVELPLAQAAMLVAAETRAECEPGLALAQLDAWRVELASRMAPEWNNLQRLVMLRKYMYDELGFHGDIENYANADNSRLDRVLTRRMGIPLTLAIVMLELGRACGMPLHGVGFPGHFLVRLAGESEDLLLDPFDHAKTVTVHDCHVMLRASSSGEMAFDESFIRNASAREMLWRLLQNLKLASLNNGDFPTALACIERLLAMKPDAAIEVRDHGLMLYRLDKYRPALASLELYLKLWSDAPDRAAMERHMLAIRMMLVGSSEEP